MELLERHFDIALETPDGISKLRGLILSLAMKGKLVKQNPKDQPVSGLLKEIDVVKHKLIKEGKIKKNETLPSIKIEEIKYDLPEGWEWVRLGSIAQHNSGKTLDGGRNVGVRREYITTSNLYWGNFVLDELRQMPFKDDELEKCSARKGDLLLCEGGEAGRAAVWDSSEEICFQNHIHRVRFYCEINSYYAYRFFEKINYTGEINNYRKGVGISNMSGKTLASILFPLPPVNEQKRIVEKIDQLMALCDKLEAERNERDKNKIKIHSTAMNRLLSAPDSTAFDSSWSFITKHFSELYSITQNVDELKKAILQLAVMGKLVPQDANDQPASELLKEIEVEKQRLVKEGKIKKQEALSQIKSEEIPYELPKGWEWTQLSQIGEINPRNNIDDELKAGFIPMPLIYAEYGKEHNFEIKKWSEIKKGYTHFAENDVVLAKITPCFENKKSCVLKNLPNGIGAGTTELHVFRNSFNKICPEYVLIFFKSPLFISTGIPKMTGSAGQKRVSKEYFSGSPFPLPPLNEQKKIVQRVNQLMELCNSLEQQIKDSTGKKSEILEAVLSKV